MRRPSFTTSIPLRLVRSPRLARGRWTRASWLGALAAVLGWLCAGAVLAEIYKWQDAAGKLHFAQDLNQVPPAYRAQAEAGAAAAGTGREIQRYQPSPAAVAPGLRQSKRRAEKRARRNAEAGPVYRVRVQKTGSTMLVRVRLNDAVTAPFFIDTGASDVVIPEAVARELGLKLDAARTGIYSTANGLVQQSLVTLDSVDLGGARAENVPATVSPSMTTGLLGLSYFNHFRYRVDPASGIVTLQSNGLVESGRIRGGRSKQQWRSQFAGLAARRRTLERTLEEINPNWARRKAELNDMIDEVDRQLAVLEDEADDARVPMQWRD